MQFEKAKNSTRNFFFGIIYRIVTLVMPFVIRTIIIYKLGNEYLGLGSLFTSLLSMLNMAELGFGAAINFCLYRPIAEGNYEETGALLNLLKKMYRLIGVIILGVGLVLMPFLDKLISGNVPADINLYILYLIYLCQSVLSYLLFSYKNSILEVSQRRDVLHKINILVDIVRYMLQIILLLTFEDYYIYVLLLPVGQIAVNLMINYYSSKLFPEIKPKGQVSKETKKVITNKVLFLSAHSITSRLSSSMGSIIVSAFLGLVPVAIYGNYTYITTAILGFTMAGYSAVQSSVGNIIHCESRKTIIDTYKSLSFAAWWVSTVLYTCVFCLFQHFMIMWVGEDSLLPFLAVVWCAAGGFVNSIRQFISMVYINTAGVWNKTIVRQILEVTTNLILSLALVQSYGVTGILFSTFITHTVIGLVFDCCIIYKEILHLPIVNGLIEIAVRCGATVLLCGTAYLVTAQIPVAGLLGFIIKGIAAAAISGVPVLLNKLRSEEMNFIWSHIKALLHRK